MDLAGKSALAGSGVAGLGGRMLTRLRAHQIRCFGTVEVKLAPRGMSVFTGPNAQGKTTLLEAACVLMRLQSPRAAVLGEMVRVGCGAGAVEGDVRGHLQRVVLGEGRRMSVDGRVVTRSAEYLAGSGLVVWMGNDDIRLARGGGEARRRFLDFGASQLIPGYLDALRGYERALRARNYLLKAGEPDSRQLAAYASEMVRHGELVRAGRDELVRRLVPQVLAAQDEISGASDRMGIRYVDGSRGGVAEALRESAVDERRRRMTLAGPHRDDIAMELHGMDATTYASEGQQRTVALALKVAQSRVLHEARGEWPLLLLDDIFGELDPGRRHRLLGALPGDAQILATTTTLGWLEQGEGSPHAVFAVRDGGVHPAG